MKKLLLTIALAVFAVSSYAQTQPGEKSLIIKGEYKTEAKQFGIGVGGRYGLIENLRIAPDAVFMFPKDKTIGLDINVNAEYVFTLEDGMSIYPLAGLNMYNGHHSGKTYFKGTAAEFKSSSNSFTEFGFNIGCGFDYNLSDTNFLNAQFTYTFNDWDYATFAIGYGIRF